MEPTKTKFKHLRDPETGGLIGTVAWEPVPGTDFVVVGVTAVHPKDRAVASKKIGRQVALERLVVTKCPIVHKDFLQALFRGAGFARQAEVLGSLALLAGVRLGVHHAAR